MMTILSTQPTTHTDVAAEVTRLASNSEFRTRNAESIKAFLRRRLRVIGDCFKHRLRSASPRAYAWLREAHNPWARLTGKIGRRQDWRVTSGPFAGMRYIDNAHGSRLIPKLVGSYEAELHEVIRRVIDAAPPVVIDVGCAEGYYAVGFARALPNASLVAFDISEPARALCAELARANDVAERIAIEGFCDCQTLHRLPLTGAFLLMDCEGFELELLRPDLVPGLAHTIILVELHDCFVPGLTEQLLARFQDTHRVRLFPLQERAPDDYPALHWLKRTDQFRAIDEDRRINGKPIEQQWALLEPKYAPGLCGDFSPNSSGGHKPQISTERPIARRDQSLLTPAATNSRTHAPDCIAP